MSYGAQRVHGISMNMLSNEPTFSERAGEIRRLFSGASCWMGYNVGFDIAMLQAELDRAGEERFKIRYFKIIDPFKLWGISKPTNLSRAHLKFVGRPLENAHNAQSDVNATIRVYSVLIERFHWQQTSIQDIIREQYVEDVDSGRQFVWDANGDVVFKNGRFRRSTVFHDSNLFKKRYLEWMIRKGRFPDDTKQIALIGLTSGDRKYANEAAEAFSGIPHLEMWKPYQYITYDIDW